MVKEKWLGERDRRYSLTIPKLYSVPRPRGRSYFACVWSDFWGLAFLRPPACTVCFPCLPSWMIPAEIKDLNFRLDSASWCLQPSLCVYYSSPRFCTKCNHLWVAEWWNAAKVNQNQQNQYCLRWMEKLTNNMQNYIIKTVDCRMIFAEGKLWYDAVIIRRNKRGPRISPCGTPARALRLIRRHPLKLLKLAITTDMCYAPYDRQPHTLWQLRPPCDLNWSQQLERWMDGYVICSWHCGPIVFIYSPIFLFRTSLK